MAIAAWDKTVSGLVQLEATVSFAEQLVSRARTRFLAPTYAASEQQVRDALAAGGIRADKINTYISEWKKQMLAVPRPLSRAQQIAIGLTPLSAAQQRRINQQNALPFLPDGAQDVAPNQPAPRQTAARIAGERRLTDLGLPADRARAMWGSSGAARIEAENTLLDLGFSPDEARTLLGPVGRPGVFPSGIVPPLPPGPQPPVPQDPIFGELPTTTDIEYPPFGGGRQ